MDKWRKVFVFAAKTHYYHNQMLWRLRVYTEFNEIITCCVCFGYCIEVHNGNNVSCRTLRSEGVVKDVQMQADAERLA